MPDKVVVLWQVIYNSDPDQCYCFCDPDSVLRSVLTAIDVYVCPGGQGEPAEHHTSLQLAQEDIRTMINTQEYALVRVAGLSIGVHRMELDRHHPIHQMLVDAVHVLNDLAPDVPVAGRLRTLFREPVSG